MLNRLSFLLAALALLMSGSAAADIVKTDHLSAQLIAEDSSLKPGTQSWVGILLAPDKGWHVYWQNPGDSGLVTRVSWDLPEGITAGDIQWPYPHRESLGDIVNYGYSEPTLHMVALTIAPATASGPAKLGAHANWLVCADICIPGSADLSLTLPVSDREPQPDPANAQAFADARAQLPKPLDAAVDDFQIADSQFRLHITANALKGAKSIEFFPISAELLNHSAPQQTRLDADAGDLLLSQDLSPYYLDPPESVDGVLVVNGASGTVAWQVKAAPGQVAALPSAPAGTAAASTTSNDGASAPADAPTQTLPASLPLVLAFAFLGGLILNLMPCVFPVLSLKALAVMRANTSEGEHRHHALAYTAGVLATFVGVASVLIALRLGGAALGWGFQLQSPLFVGILVYVLFILGLSMSGHLEIGGRLMGIGQSLTQRQGMAGSFFTGVLAVVVASPCTAPFMGTALGYALTQPPIVALLVFAVLGLGLALPFLLLGFVPKLAAWLPKPGAWMQTFRQLLAFPLYLTVVWLLYVLGGLTDRYGMALALVGLVLIGFAVWLASLKGRATHALAALATLAALAVFAHPALRGAGAPVASTAGAPTAWSQEQFDTLRAQGRTVFVDFTADWCLTCKVNEKLALRSDKVQKAFAAHDVAYMVGDWTRTDPEITKVLQRYGRSGVPLYLISVNGGEPQVLPQLLTPDMVANAVAGASSP